MPAPTPDGAVEAAAALAPRLAAAAAATDHDGGFPSEALDWLRKAGLLTAPLAVADGGRGLNETRHLGALLRVLAHVGRGNLSVGRLYEGHVNGLALVQRLGTPAQVARAARDAAAGRLFGVWNTQAQDGVRMTQRRAGGRVTLAGSKTFASGAGHVARALVTAQDAQGRWRLLVVPTDTAVPAVDASFWRPLGMRATASFKADFTGLEISAGCLLGEPGDYLREPWFSAGAIRFAAVQLGGAEAVFDETRAFLRGLGRLDDPYQRMRLGEMATLIEGGALWLDGAARRHASIGPAEPPPAAAGSSPATAGVPTAPPSAGLVAYVNMARGAVEEACLRVMQLAERSVGARGLLKPGPLERLHRDLTHYLRQPAPDAALAHVGASVLGSGLPAHGLWPG